MHALSAWRGRESFDAPPQLPSAREPTFLLDKIVTLAAPEGNHQYLYDTLGRLERWTEPNATRHRYFFDLDHNRTQKTVNESVVQTLTYAADATDRLLSVNGGAAYTYGPAGEVLTRPGQTLEWEDFGNLKKVTLSAGASVTFDRDALGRIRQRTERDASNAIVSDVRYRFNGSADSPAYETNAAGTLIVKSHLAGPDGLTITYAGNRGGTPTYSYSDIHGNVAAVADAAGTITGGPYSYDPFGNVVGAQVPTPYGFVGRWQKYSDPLAGLVLMGARPYDPVLGRFLSVDPVPGGSANDYDYAFQDPVNVYDLDGRWGWVNWGRQILEPLLNRWGTRVGHAAANLANAARTRWDSYTSAARSGVQRVAVRAVAWVVRRTGPIRVQVGQ
jgi:RHS repeat-associated protein